VQAALPPPVAQPLTCSNLASTISTANKVSFLNNSTAIFINYALGVLVSYNMYLSTIDSMDLFKRLSGSMKNELASYKDQEISYKLKADANNKTIDLTKHDMIFKTSLLSMITNIACVICALFAMYMSYPEYLKIYLIITGIIVFYCVYKFYYSILHPVRTRARNKYWYKAKV